MGLSAKLRRFLPLGEEGAAGAADPLVIFLHIPRAGGTSLWRALREVYGRRMRRIKGGGSADTQERIAALLKERPYDYDLLGGHVRFGIGEHCTARPYRYLTVLRDPTEVILSRYYKRLRPEDQARKIRNHGGDPTRVSLPTPGLSPVEALRDRARNPLIRVLSGLPQGRVNSHEGLEAAKKNLAENFGAFGFVEHYEETLELMAAELGWERVPQPEARNPGTNRPPAYAPEVYEVGRKVCALDYELYDFAQQLFDERRRAHSLDSGSRTGEVMSP